MDRACQACPKTFQGRKDAKYCSDACRERARRRRLAAAAPVVALPAPTAGYAPSPLVAAIEQQLATAERLTTPAGQMALLLARRLSAGLDTGSAQAALVREVKAQLDDALAGAKLDSDALDELRARRERKAASA